MNSESNAVVGYFRNRIIRAWGRPFVESERVRSLDQKRIDSGAQAVVGTFRNRRISDSRAQAMVGKFRNRRNQGLRSPPRMER